MITDEYRSIPGMFIKPVELESKKLSQINLQDKSLHLDLELIDLGGRCEMHLIKEPLKEFEVSFHQDYRKFLFELCNFPLTRKLCWHSSMFWIQK